MQPNKYVSIEAVIVCFFAPLFFYQVISDPTVGLWLKLPFVGLWVCMGGYEVWRRLRHKKLNK